MTVGYLRGDNSRRARGDPHVAHHNDLADAINSGGGGSQPFSTASITVSAAELNAATTAADAIELVPAQGAGKVVVVLTLDCVTDALDSVLDATLRVAYGTDDAPVYYISANLAVNFDAAVAQELYTTDDLSNQPLGLFIEGGLVGVDCGPWTFTAIYRVVDTSP